MQALETRDAHRVCIDGRGLHVLVLADQDSADTLQPALERAGATAITTRVHADADYLAALDRRPDVVLCALPGLAEGALQLLVASGLDLPFIIVSDAAGEDLALEALRDGADDYLLEDRLGRLGPAIAAALERRRLRGAARHASDALRETQGRLWSFLENSPAAIFMKDEAGRYLNVNREFLRSFQLEESAVLGRCDEEIFPAEQAQAYRANDALALGAGEPLSFEETSREQDGVHTHIVVKFPLHNATGGVYGIGGIATDITARKEVEERYRATFNQAAVGMVHTATDGRFIEVNNQFCAIVGYSREELLGRSFLEVLHPDDHEPSRARQEQLLTDPAAPSSSVRELRCIRKNGSLLWMNVAVTLVRRPSGEAVHFIAMVQDVSARKAAEDRFRATFEQAAVGIAHTSLDRRYLMVNRKLCDLTGYSRQELLSMRTNEVLHPDDRVPQPEQELLLEGKLERFSAEKRYLRKDGSIIWVNRTVSLVRDASGTPLYFLRVIEDVTERRRAQTRAALLQATTLAISQAQDMDTALSTVLQRICETTGWSFGRAWLPDSAGSALECRAAWHDGRPELEAFQGHKCRLPTDTDTGLAVSTFRSKRSMRMTDLAAAGPSCGRGESALSLGFTSWAGIPVLAGENPVALLEFFLREDENHEPELVDAVAVVATQLGILFQRKAAEASLRESEERFRQLAENVPGVFWMTDSAQELVTYVGPAFEQLTGRSAADVGYGQLDWLTVVHEEDRDRVERDWMRRGPLGTYDVEYRLIHGDGGERWVHDRAFPVRNARGEIDRIAGLMENITERKHVQEQLEQLAHYDHLTGLPNRALFYDRLQQALAHAERSHQSVGVFLVDLDRFKLINDTLGHTIGDKLLQRVAERLTRTVRSGDTIGHLGGDEFAVVVSELAAPADTRLVAQHILAALADAFDVDGHEIFMTASIGIALHPADGTDLDALISAADAAMHGSKSAGGNTCQFYTAEMNDRALERMQLENSLRRALDRDELLLHFQPKVDIGTGEISGFEALLRWQSPERGLVPPDQFIPVLEATGLIVPVGEWALRKACQQIRAWTNARLRPVPIAVNLSARQFREQDLSAVVRRTLHEFGVAPRFLELEITESAAMQNTEACIATLKELKALGVHLALDDFGTGYSSLSYLKRLPVDTVKIDRSFITDLATNPDDASIAQAIINMAHNLGLKVVAEGVETLPQLAFLGAHGCDCMQGYYFSRALPEHEATSLLRENRRLQRPAASADGDERTLLLLDDDENVLSALKRLLRRDSYRILTASSAREAFEILASHEVGVIVSDQRMPEVTGVEFLRRVKELYPDSVRMVLSGYTDLDSVTDAINQGAIYRFLTKPWEDNLLRAHIAEAFRQYARLQEAKRTHESTRARIAELTDANRVLEKTLAGLGAAPQLRLVGQSAA